MARSTHAAEAIEEAVEKARVSILSTVTGYAAREAAADLARAFGFTVTEEFDLQAVARDLGIDLPTPQLLDKAREGRQS